MNILMVGDVFGEPGRRALQTLLPRLKREHEIDCTVVNVENAAAGFGVTPQMCRDFHGQGADVLTSGNHIWDRKEIVEYIVKENLLLRPANFPPGTPGAGYVTVKCVPHRASPRPRLKLLDGKAVAQKILGEVAGGVRDLRARTGVTPTLAVVLVGDFAASKIYIANKKKAADGVGIASRDFIYPDGLSRPALSTLLESLNADPAVHGILLQLPLPAGFDEDAVIAAIAPEKDVDGFHPQNLGRLLAGAPTVLPCTPAGCLEILDHYGAELTGAEAVVVGRSRIVGKPLAQLLLARNATVTLCHTRTRDLAAHTRPADVLCVAAGRPGVITGPMVKAGAWVIDVGINRLETGKLVGDVDFDSASQRAGAITPVPGGVGPMTIAMLLRNTLAAARRQLRA